MSCNTCSHHTSADNFSDDYYKSHQRLSSFNYLYPIESTSVGNIVEVRFKGTRKSLYYNQQSIPLRHEDLVAVEAQSGHDIGKVSLTGRLAEFQFKRRHKSGYFSDLPVVYRTASLQDIEHWREAKTAEVPAMLQARKISQAMELKMKIGDVEYQGDGKKAIFYYIADGRVDFRILIRKLAEAFGVKIEMKQIGARQEAGLIGGIGSCGRELCCSTWKTNFQIIPLATAKYQDLSPNAQKLAGQCGKLKCCLMYEIDNYLEAWEEFPKELIEIQTKKGIARPIKTDVLTKRIFYSYQTDVSGKYIAVTTDEAKKLVQENKRGIIPDDLLAVENKPSVNEWKSGEDDLLDRQTKNRRRKKL